MIDPKSTAGILLREYDNPQQALAYAERMTARLGAMGNGVGCDYAEAARQIRDHIACGVTACGASQPTDEEIRAVWQRVREADGSDLGLHLRFARELLRTYGVALRDGGQQ